jgi:hypothetical protein
MAVNPAVYEVVAEVLAAPRAQTWGSDPAARAACA